MKIKEAGTGRTLVSFTNWGTVKFHVDDPLPTCPVEVENVVKFALMVKEGGYKPTPTGFVRESIYKQATDFIKEQQAEIEELKAERKSLRLKNRKLENKLLVIDPPF